MSKIITVASMEREITNAELATQNALLESSEAAGTTNGSFASPIDRRNGAVRIWSTVEAANAWIAMLNTFTPPPVVAEVETI